VSDPLDESTVDTPTVRDPDRIVYFRGARAEPAEPAEPAIAADSGRPSGADDHALLVGGYIRDPDTAWPDDGTAPLSAPRTLFEPNLTKFAESWANARHRVPALRSRDIYRVVHGPEAFTPDGEFLLGETPVGGFWVAAGFCVHGLAAAGGVGKALAEWIVDGSPEYDMSTMDIRRFGAHAASRSWATAKAIDAYARYYDIVYPFQEWSAARPLRRSAVWPRLVELDAALGEKAGWERANWFGVNAFPANAREGGTTLPADAREGGNAVDTERVQPPKGWAGKNWSPAIAAECRATTEVAGLFDQSSFAKLDVRGPNAAAQLNYLCANQIDRPVGSVTYTQLLNRKAGIEADLTVTRLGEQHFRLVTSTASGVRDAMWLRRHLTDGVTVDDVTGQYGCLCLWGPAARELLQPLSDTSLAAADFGYLRAQSLTVGHVPVIAQRVTFVGELGWELYAPTEYTLSLWDTLMAAGRPLGMRPAGYRAIEAMRLEKGYRVWGADITPETTPDEAGLQFAVRTEKPFLGREALLRRRLAGEPARRLRCLVLDDPGTVCLGTEPVRVDGTPTGRVTSGGVGYRVGASIAYAYLPSTVDVGTRVQVSVFDTWHDATVMAEPLFDPANARIR
jgi:glycine cleavage system aminomethyltransferase T